MPACEKISCPPTENVNEHLGQGIILLSWSDEMSNIFPFSLYHKLNDTRILIGSYDLLEDRRKGDVTVHSICLFVILVKLIPLCHGPVPLEITEDVRMWLEYQCALRATLVQTMMSSMITTEKIHLLM